MPDWALTSAVGQRNGDKIVIRLHISNRSDYAYYYQVQGLPDTKDPDYIQIKTNRKPAFFRRIYASSTHRSGQGSSRLYNHLREKTWGYFQPFPEDDTNWISYTYVEPGYHSLLCDKGWRSPSPGALSASQLDSDIHALWLRNSPAIPRSWQRDPGNSTRTAIQSNITTREETQPNKDATSPSSSGSSPSTHPPRPPTDDVILVPPFDDEEEYPGFPSAQPTKRPEHLQLIQHTTMDRLQGLRDLLERNKFDPNSSQLPPITTDGPGGPLRKLLNPKDLDDERIQRLGDIDATLFNLERAVLINYSKLSDGRPTITLLGQPAQSPYAELVLTTDLITNLNKIALGASVKCTKALIEAQLAVMDKLTQERETLLEDWEPSTEGLEAAAKITTLKSCKTTTYIPKPIPGGIQTFLLPKEGETAASIQPNPEASRIHSTGFRTPRYGGRGTTGGGTSTGGGGSGNVNSDGTRPRSRPRSHTNDGARPRSRPSPHTNNVRPHRQHPKPPSPAPDHYRRSYHHTDDRHTDNRHRPRDRTPSPYRHRRNTPERRRHDHSPEPRSRYFSRKN